MSEQHTKETHTAPKATGTDVSDANAAVGDVKTTKTFYSVAPPKKTGTLDQSDATAVAGDINSGKTAYANFMKLTGTLALTGNTAVGDERSAKTFYNTDSTSIQTGTLVIAKDADANGVQKSTTSASSIYHAAFNNAAIVSYTITTTKHSIIVIVGALCGNIGTGNPSALIKRGGVDKNNK